ncbi:DUF983 domain-containing protein [Flavobacterium sp. DGU11]|uniref:DUF983 domain-containing protein n=1 Tax=Flavobacterium arundinis TaxID=3139143 RepID=A0ABU9I0I6_9FLAO
MKKRNVLVNIFRLKCPRCHKGNLFTVPGLFVMSKALAMPQKCPHCHQDFTIEPGFYSAALWISYPIVVALLAFLLVLGYYLHESLKVPFKVLLPVLMILCFLLQVPIMRIARAILINITIAYQDDEMKQ